MDGRGKAWALIHALLFIPWEILGSLSLVRDSYYVVKTVCSENYVQEVGWGRRVERRDSLSESFLCNHGFLISDPNSNITNWGAHKHL